MQRERLSATRTEAVAGFSLAMFEHASEYREVYHASLNTQGWSLFRQRLEEMFDEIIRRKCKVEIHNVWAIKDFLNSDGVVVLFHNQRDQSNEVVSGYDEHDDLHSRFVSLLGIGTETHRLFRKEQLYVACSRGNATPSRTLYIEQSSING